MVGYPEDFSFSYRWQMGSVPPPYYYEYTVQVNPDGGGTIELLPDYPMHHPEKRVISIQLDSKKMEKLFEEMQNAGIFDQPFHLVDSSWLGGSRSSLDVRADGQDFHIPAAISSADSRRLDPVFLAIQELLPSQLLSGLPGN
jgi:hypothetical protein